MAALPDKGEKIKAKIRSLEDALANLSVDSIQVSLMIIFFPSLSIHCSFHI